MATLQAKGFVAKPKWLAKHQRRAKPQFIGSTNFQRGKSAFAYYQFTHTRTHTSLHAVDASEIFFHLRRIKFGTQSPA